MNSVWLYRSLAALMLAAIAVQQLRTVHGPGRVREYQERIRAAAAEVPTRIGPWVGRDAPVSVQAVSTLRPNVMLSRRYLNVENGVYATVSLVHCANAHHMIGHFPLRCYPAEGWNLRASRERNWAAGDLSITGMEYEFTREELGDASGERAIVVANCLFRSGGRVLRDMAAMSEGIGGAGDLSTGAAQVQIVFDAGTPPERRESAVRSLLEGYLPVIRAILADVQR